METKNFKQILCLSCWYNIMEKLPVVLEVSTSLTVDVAFNCFGSAWSVAEVTGSPYQFEAMHSNVNAFGTLRIKLKEEHIVWVIQLTDRKK